MTQNPDGYRAYVPTGYLYTSGASAHVYMELAEQKAQFAIGGCS